MYCFVKQGIRGGMAGVMLEREAVANNEFFPVFLESMPQKKQICCTLMPTCMAGS